MTPLGRESTPHNSSPQAKQTPTPMDTPSLIERANFWAKVEKIPFHSCWEWTGRRSEGGYGQFSMNHRNIAAHRMAYELLVGPIPAGLDLDHLCRNRSCVNPDHLEPVTERENVLRGIGPTAQNARKTHCIRGHELSAGNLYVRRSGWRHCRTCHRIEMQAYRQRRDARLTEGGLRAC